ncbi:AzlC family ABC transporter permease [Marinivivus vitaminiproducens]|uniref:AzlC family ABC transporter permease n=1 Tax=Marinivivus vitaminiproducens TaxID=3035935 RepID=UPI0027A13C72|nr:AzlC family ABC transporter permease [Geminicoccaceae bacterium SCSIO 64248]
MAIAETRPSRGDGALAGFLLILPVLVATAPFGLLWGAIAARQGLSAAEVALMSGLVFAGGAQFVVIDLWREPAPVLFMTVTAALVNVRHILMGAAFPPLLTRFRPGLAYAGLFLLVDESWALALRRAEGRPLDPAFWFGLTVPMWFNWTISTTAGALLGQAIADPAGFGLDFAFTAIFIGLTVGLWRGVSRSFLPWLASAAAASAAYLLIGSPWHVAAGGLAGLLIGAWQAGGRPEEGGR